MTTAADVRKTLKTEEITINPSIDLTEEAGSFLLGAIIARRDVPYEGKTFKVYDMKVEDGKFSAYTGKGENRKNVKWSKGVTLQLKGTAMINWAFSNLADGSRVLVEYRGLKKSSKKGQNDAHDFLVERVAA